MISKRNYKICNRCLMDTSAIEIQFDNEGNCHFCNEFLNRSYHIINKDKDLRDNELLKLIETIKSKGKNKKYDCIIGVSGGVDSSWALLKAVELGLRPLAVHMDNNWDSELAQHNIANLVTKLNVDLYTHVINWKEYKGLMQAFFDADVVDIELLYDNAAFALCYNMASKHRVKYILGGQNDSTEGLHMSIYWNWFKHDVKNIKAISKAYNGPKLSTFPSINTIQYIWAEYIKKHNWLKFGNYFDFNKEIVLKELKGKIGFREYPYKHYESVFTRFYQGYILPRKFSIDKRRGHLGALVVTGQMSRNDAIEELKKIPYPSEKDLEGDKQYFLKKMGWSADDLEDYINRPRREHGEFSSEKWFWDLMRIPYRKYIKRDNQ